MMPPLPKNYWDFIMDYLPDYSRRDDVLQSDIYTRYLDGEEVSDDDVQYFFADRLREDIETEYLSNEWNLFLEAFENFATKRYENSIEYKEDPYVIEPIANRTFIPDSDGAYFITNFQVYTVDGFLDKYLGDEIFIYEITGPMDDAKMHHFNNKFKRTVRKGKVCFDIATSERMNYLKGIGCDLVFVNPVREVARANLVRCGGMEMPAIVGGMLKRFYFVNSTECTTMEDCAEYLADNDVAGYGFDDLETIYRGKIANLLLCFFTGMRLGTPWNGRHEVNGGYIVVKSNGDVATVRSMIAEEFKDFLVAKMIMEVPSHSRHKDMEIYKEGDKYYLKLPLQLRFALNG